MNKKAALLILLGLTSCKDGDLSASEERSVTEELDHAYELIDRLSEKLNSCNEAYEDCSAAYTQLYYACF